MKVTTSSVLPTRDAVRPAPVRVLVYYSVRKSNKLLRTLFAECGLDIAEESLPKFPKIRGA